MEGLPKSVTLTLEGGQYYVSVTCEVEVPDPVFSTPFVADGDAIRVDADLVDYLSDGLDFGVIRNWCDARGGVFDVPGWRPGEDIRKLRLERGIGRQEEARKQREKEARERGLLPAGQRLPQSKRQIKRRKNLSALQGRVKRRNRDAIHKFTTTKAKSHGLIGLEGLGIKNMTASYRPSSAWSEAGTAEDPGTNVAAKAALNRKILGASPGFTRTLFRYKGDRFGYRPSFAWSEAWWCWSRQPTPASTVPSAAGIPRTTSRPGIWTTAVSARRTSSARCAATP
jgi:putative transposase